MTEHYDIIIIGSGAGGGTLARRLAPTGLKILILERGGFLPRERENWDEKEVFQNRRYLANETWYDKSEQPFNPYTHYWVGGNTKVYGAALLRMREHDFSEVRHIGGLSPAWPLSYADLEPHYTEAERLYSVHGTRGLDPTEPRASAPLPHPPLPHEPRIAALEADLRTQGLHPFPAPIGVRLNQSRAPHASVKLARFDGYPDPTHTKADAQVVGIDTALAHNNVTILTNAFAERLLTSNSGREVTGVVAMIDGQRQILRADFFVTSCGAVNSAALLLRSANSRHPHGLANSSDQVGRNYMCHNNGVFIFVSDQPNDAQFQKTLGLTDFYRTGGENNLPLGTIQLMGKLDRYFLADLAKEKLPGVPVEEVAAHSIDFFITAEDLPDPNNRVTLRNDGTIRLSYSENNMAAYRGLERKLIDILDTIERSHNRRPGTYLTAKLGISGVSHQSGTLRFGHDQRTSVLDTDCKTHDLDNLYIVDSSFFPSSSAVNPSLTIMANALRVGDHITDRMNAMQPASHITRRTAFAST